MREDQGARQSGDPPPAIAGTDAHADVTVHMTSRDTVGALVSEHQASTPMLDNLRGLECVTPLGGNQFGTAIQVEGMAGLTRPLPTWPS